MRRPISVLLMIVVSTFFFIQTAFAVPISLSEFSGGGFLEDFQSSPQTNFGLSFTLNGVTYSESEFSLFTQSGAGPLLFANISGASLGAALTDGHRDAILNIDFSVPTDKVGVLLSSGGVLSWEVNIFDSSLSLLESMTITQPEEYHAVFAGFQRNENIARLQIDRISDSEDLYYTFIDDVRYETAPVPEPATMLLLGSGLIGLWGFRRKFRK